MKRIVCFFITIILINIPLNYSYANSKSNINIQNDDIANQTLTEQQEEFGISDFIEESKQYTGEFFSDIDINEILEKLIMIPYLKKY